MNVTRSLLDDIKTKQLQWYGHVQRMEEGRLPKEVMKWRPTGRRKRGRPNIIQRSKNNSQNTTKGILAKMGSG
jgi:hypothetical protein